MSCDNLKRDRLRCDACRTINLARPMRHEKPDMAMYDKCSQAARIDCTRIAEVPLHPTCIKVCSREEMLAGRKHKPKVLPKIVPYRHGKCIYGIKAGILAGAIYFTYTQGVWGTQQDSAECLRRWQEYARSLNSRRPPNFDRCGRVVVTEQSNSVLGPAYNLYKSVVTTCFSGVVKVPVLIKCAYIDYLETMEKRWKALVKERHIKKNTPKDG